MKPLSDEDLKSQVEHLNASNSVAMQAIQFIMSASDPDEVNVVSYAADRDERNDWTSMRLIDTHQGNNPIQQNVAEISIGKLAQLAAYAYVTGLDKIREEVRQMEERYRREADHLNRRLSAQAHVIERLGGAT